jgi:peptide-methionine (R)-S-oxide reductase
MARRRVERTPDEWRSRLAPEQFEVAREAGTEGAFTGAYWNEHRSGRYVCVCCGEELFSSEAKFDSGTGWPSFWAPSTSDGVRAAVDSSHGMVRDEVVCATCDAHLGHVFPDGPKPAGLRYCINSASLRFEENKK